MEAEREPRHDIDDVTGEHLAVDPDEIVIRIGDRVIPASEVKLRLKEGGEYVIEHKEFL